MKVPFIAIALALICAASWNDDSATLRVHADRPGVRVSPMLYGVFFEEINHAGDGGLYAEMVITTGIGGTSADGATGNMESKRLSWEAWNKSVLM